MHRKVDAKTLKKLFSDSWPTDYKRGRATVNNIKYNGGADARPQKQNCHEKSHVDLRHVEILVLYTSILKI